MVVTFIVRIYGERERREICWCHNKLQCHNFFYCNREMKMDREREGKGEREKRWRDREERERER